jgi:hypothetical protein
MNTTIDIKFGSELHKRILDGVRVRVKNWEGKIGDRKDKWKKSEEQFLAYRPEKEIDAERRIDREVGGAPQLTTLVVPYSYGVLLAAHTYWTTVFLSRTPVLQYMARHGETTDKVMSVEALMDYQVQVGGMIPVFYNWLFDPGKYGCGIVGCYWEEEMHTIAEMTEEPVTYLGIPIPGKTKKTRTVKQIPGYQGNKIFNVHPSDFIFDPRVPLWRFQEGEFCGRRAVMGWNEVVRRAIDKEYRNIDILQKMRRKGSEGFEERMTAQVEQPDQLLDFDTRDIKDVGSIHVEELVIELIPKMWGLGNSESPEKWLFTIAEDKVVIGARPQGCYHNKYPFAVIEYELDAYALFKRSMLEVISPLQDTLDWLINSHLYNVRQTLNNQLVADPSKVVMKDLMDPRAGKLIRLRPDAYGTDVRTVVHQLQVVDITQTHLRDMSVVTDFFQRATGVNDNIFGMVNSGGRKSATEIRSSNSFGVSRLKTETEVFSAFGFSPLSTILLQNTQQYYSADKQFRIAGDLLQGMPVWTQVNPDAIAGFYDYVPVDGALPVDRYAQANLIREAIMGAAKSPQIAQAYNMAGLFGYAMQLAGIKNIERFKVQVMPDQQVAQEAAAGNLTPLPEKGIDKIPEPAQSKGIGRTT